jgi:hypothetical protein
MSRPGTPARQFLAPDARGVALLHGTFRQPRVFLSKVAEIEHFVMAVTWAQTAAG